MPTPDGPGDQPHNAICNSYEKNVIGSYGSLAMFKSLNRKLPDVPLDAWPTCNRFKAEDCEGTWDEHVATFRLKLEVHRIFGTGFGSDGDPRRANLQMQRMSLALNKEARASGLYRCDKLHECLEFAPTVRHYNTDHPDLPDDNGNHKCPAENIHVQDPKHCLKKTFTILFGNKVTAMGPHACSLNHVMEMMKRHKAGWEGHACRVNDGHPADRQNVGSPSRVSGHRMMDLLRDWQAAEGEDALGTRTLLMMMSDCQQTFFSTKLGLEERMEKISLVLNCLRLWSWAVRDDDRHTLKDSSYPAQTYRHLALSLHSALFIILTFRDHGDPGADVFAVLRRLGSDVCERVFSMAGGHGQLVAGRRNHSCAGFCDMLRKMTAVDTITATNQATRCKGANSKGE